MTTLPMANGGAGAFHWSPVAGGLFAFDGNQLRSLHPMHLHTWYSIYVVTSGSVRLWCRDREWVATPGMVVLLSPYETHAEFYSPFEGCSFRGVYPIHARLRAVLGDSLDARSFLRFRHPVLDEPGLAAKVLVLCESLRSAGVQRRGESVLSASRRGGRVKRARRR
ncbi:MAG: AraC family ligand binding domain-containing protein [Gemmatimonadota bacterium]